jgi:signal transduction histidine kinase
VPTVNADAKLMRIVLENLIGNAWKYTRDKKPAKIEFGSRQLQHEVEFYLRDNGIGFDMKDADRLFDPFERVHSRQEFEGSGIGLATVKRILDRHAGRIRAEAVPGLGATFFFTLPV